VGAPTTGGDMLTAIETEYNGYRFRSRIEARWAVMFDALDLKYRYEMEGFELADGRWYLPDFWLPDLPGLGRGSPGWWVEIKGQAPTEEEHVKAALLAQQGRQGVLLLWSNFDTDSALNDELMFHYDHRGIFHVEQGWCFPCVYSLLIPFQTDGIVNDVWKLLDARLADAWAAARSARFERREHERECPKDRTARIATR